MQKTYSAFKRKILIVEDSEINREILASLLEDEYDLLLAENGLEGFHVLQENGRSISAILLDIQMPICNGFEFLEKKREDQSLDIVPVLVTTSSDSYEDEIHSLSLGANDFIRKPYNVDIIKNRLSNIIKLRETSSLLIEVEINQETGFYTYEFFMRYVKSHLDSVYASADENANSYYLISAVMRDLTVIQGLFGNEVSQAMENWAARCLREQIPGLVFGGFFRHGVFLLLVKSEDGTLPDLTQISFSNLSLPSNIEMSYGYVLAQKHTPLRQQCADALVASQEASEKHGTIALEFTKSMRDGMFFRRRILDESAQALESGQFMPYYQPKHSVKTEKIAGAEALVRWIHPEMGFMSPGVFIPLFEQNDFIVKLDYYIWETVCKDLRSWIDAGVSVVPVSVNISRRNFSDEQLYNRIIELVDKYELPHELLHLEVTESACLDEDSSVVDQLAALHDAGFTLELDDFGTGYSSLATLCDVEFDIMKIDMSLVRQENADAQDSILRMAINIAKMRGMKTVAEGVETAEKVQEMCNLGCDYIQGYYYSKPLPKAEFDAYLRQHI